MALLQQRKLLLKRMLKIHSVDPGPVGCMMHSCLVLSRVGRQFNDFSELACTVVIADNGTFAMHIIAQTYAKNTLC